MRKLTIYRYFARDSDCYRAAQKQTPRGVQVHRTVSGASYLKRWVGPDDGLLGKNRYSNHHNRPGGDVLASAYIGRLDDGTVACYQTLPWNYRCWLSGSKENGNANKLGYIGFEIAADINDDAYFQAAVMDISVSLTAHLCLLMDTTPDAVLETYKQGNALAVMDHSELHRLRLASNHADITDWLKKYGLTMDDYRQAVSDAIQEGVEVTYMDRDPLEKSLPTLRKGSKGDAVREAQEALMAAGYDVGKTGADGIFGGETLSAVRAFQHDHGLSPDGIIGAATWAELKAVEPAEPSEPTEPKPAPLTVEERLARLEAAVFGAEGGESIG